ncbi:MAG: hypothetical protein VZR09_01555 [Candidatus Gastranaerophilaceae bacterium]|nr:hypothetical protein [Candidatus Gastranaerophilaceae bacterium]
MDDMFTSPMYRDMIGASTSPMGMALGVGNPYYQTNFLGGTMLYTGVPKDVYHSIKNEQGRNLSYLKKAVIGLGTFLGGTLILSRFHKLGKAIANTKTYKKLFK